MGLHADRGNGKQGVLMMPECEELARLRRTSI